MASCEEPDYMPGHSVFIVGIVGPPTHIKIIEADNEGINSLRLARNNAAHNCLLMNYEYFYWQRP